LFSVSKDISDNPTPYALLSHRSAKATSEDVITVDAPPKYVSLLTGMIRE
jgi:hypothetical protein